MAKSKPDRQSLLAAIAAHVLAHGLNSASLRPMAAAAGTSDRMLIYHFGSKEGLVAGLLDHLAAEMKDGLTAALPPEPFRSEAELVVTLVGLMRSEAFQPYVRVWLDIVSAAAQGQVAHRAAGRGVMGLYLDWIAARHPSGPAAAPRTLTLIEGILVMDAVGQSEIADAVLAGLG